MMKTRQIGHVLREMRMNHGMTVNDVAVRLKDDYGMDISKKTIYGWESDRSYPRTETLLALCEIYGIHDIATEFLEAPEITEFHISADERNMILKYRQCPDLQSAVKRVLDVPDATEDADVLVAKVH